VQSYRKAGQIAVQKVKEIQIRVAESDAVGRRQMLERVAGTALNSKLISHQKAFFSPMVGILCYIVTVTMLCNLLMKCFTPNML
jgi:T-complex protein 1 subunit eta